ncbi:MAG: DNA polymerase [Moraxellaceae bacterium]
MEVALWDTETNGLLEPQEGKTVATKMHCFGMELGGKWWSCSDAPEFQAVSGGMTLDVTLPSGQVLKDVYHCTIQEGLRALEGADLRVAHNGQSYDERVTRKLFPWWKPRGNQIDTLIMSRTLYPDIYKQGPNTHKVPGMLKSRHSVEAWGYRLGEKKNKGFDPGDWQTWSWDMQTYMLQDIVSLKVIWTWLMAQKPSMDALRREHDFAAIINRQVSWGFTVDYAKLLKLSSDVETVKAKLEVELVETFGEWWEGGSPTRVKTTRRVKVPGHPDVTMARYGSTGKRLPKDYVGPPLCTYEEGAVYTPIKRVEFSPGSRDHVSKILEQRYGWKPTRFTKTGKPQVDDEVLRALNYPEAPLLADYFAAVKVGGFVSAGKNAWLKLVQEEGTEWRMHGQVITIGTYTFRCSHFLPNMGQIPTRDPTWGHRCRELFITRKGFGLAGADGSGMQLRLLAHHLAKYDGGIFAKVVSEADPHAYMRDTVGTDLMGEGDEGRAKGKTLNYALVFGGGDRKLGSIIAPHASEAEQKRLGRLVKERLAERFGALDMLKADLKTRVEARGNIVGLDGRKAPCAKAHTALSTLLQMGEKIVMSEALIIFDRWMQDAGYTPGVDDCGRAWPDAADYEFTANVHDEFQADVREHALEDYQRLALLCVAEAGRRLGVNCPLKSDVKVGASWKDTH